MSLSRRQALEAARSGEAQHAGLWFDRFLARSAAPDAQAKQALVNEVADIQEPAGWRPYFDRWTRTLATLGAQTKELRVNGRLIVGLGGESTIETAITLHHTYGVPLIPGSALKGLAAAYARQRLDVAHWSRGGDAYQVLFGDTSAAGYVTVFDALYVPGTGWQGRALHPDVLTVHHPDYYQGQPAPPADWDSPNPVPFLTATGRYLLAVGGPAEWAQAALTILLTALAEWGVGAKTSSGYGRLTVIQPVQTPPLRPDSATATGSAGRAGLVRGASVIGLVHSATTYTVTVHLEGYPSTEVVGRLPRSQFQRSLKVGQRVRATVQSTRPGRAGVIEVDLSLAEEE